MEKVRLGDVCSKDSSNIAQKDLDNKDGTFPIYGASGFIKNVDFYKQEKEYIAVVKDGAGVGRVMKCPAKSSVIGTMQYILPKENINIDFLAFAMENMNLAKYYTGATIPHIYFKDYSKEEIPSLTPEEQDYVAKKMNKIIELIDKRKAQIEKLDELVKARFVELFGNILCDSDLPLVQLKELADIGSSKRIYANEYVESGVPFYRSKEIRELGTGLKPSVELFIKQERYDEIKVKYGVPKKGDILIAAIGATIGYSWIVDTDKPFYYKDGNLIILSTKNNVNPIFLNHTMGILIEDFKSKGVAGSAQLALTIEKLEKMMVINPTLELQNQFAAFVEQLDKSKLEVQKSLEKLEVLKKALMQKYFG